MDGIITTILAGVIVALIGAYAAYYFGGLRERHKRAYEERREEQEKQEEIQREQNKEAAEALDGMRPQIVLVARAYVGWVEEAAAFDRMVAKNLIVEGEKGKRLEAQPSQVGVSATTMLERAGEVLRKGDQVSNLMSALRDYYWQRKPTLSEKTRELFESFEARFEERHGALSNTSQVIVPRFQKAARLSRKSRALFLTWLIPGVNLATFPAYLLTGIWDKKRIEEVEEYWQAWRTAIRSAQDWDILQYTAAFDAEAERLRRNA